MLVNTLDMTVLITGEHPSWLNAKYDSLPLQLKDILIPTESPHHYMTVESNRLLYICSHPVSSPHHMLLMASDVTDLNAGNHLCLRVTEYGVIEAYSLEQGGLSQDVAMDDILLNRPIMSLVHEDDIGLLCNALRNLSDCRVRWQVNPSTSYWDEEHVNIYYAWANIYVQQHEDWFMCVIQLPNPSMEWSILNLAIHPTASGLLHMAQMRLINSNLYHAMGLTIRAFSKFSTLAILSLTKENHLLQKYTNTLKSSLRHQEKRPPVRYVLSVLAHLNILSSPSQPREFVEDALDVLTNMMILSESDPTPQSIV
ncbi:hypothetical protein K450DRAFT_234694 [Umbelopsis ramanniana AG]|uniref:Uncharacterized protein n=1 Tax=Umbelopsis ramanniana AG TaxID=1314678 RepID=A0AAD5EBX5_UMBRA|nr:uncharacterized protein K450DRAFT_234694 [Umbelopsis ramanniana AG]KAI8581113.1 hypothetical protein K450DRAFT_234694 [Umbelopsis ramanniana AG]